MKKHEVIVMNRKKPLTKSAHNKWLFGVLGGFAEYFSLDPTLVRVGFLLLSLLPGPSVLFYILCAIIMPKEERPYA